jgi:hypothetical protein
MHSRSPKALGLAPLGHPAGPARAKEKAPTLRVGADLDNLQFSPQPELDRIFSEDDMPRAERATAAGTLQ